MKKTNQIISIILAVLMLALSAPLALAEGNVVLCTPCGENGQWLLDDQGKLTISGTGEMPWPDQSTMPLWKDRIDSIKSLVIQSGITSIPDEVFYGCSSIQQLQLPDTLISIGDYAFFMLTEMETLVIPESVTTIGDYAFDGCCSLKNLVIPAGVQEIGDYAFELCLSLESIRNYSKTAVTTNCGTFHLKQTEFWTTEKMIAAGKWILDKRYYVMFPLNDGNENNITAKMLQEFNGEFGTTFETASEYLALLHGIENAGAADNPTVYCYSDSAEKQSCVERGYNYQLIDDELSGQCGDNLTWTLNKGAGVLTISGEGVLKEYGYGELESAPWQDAKDSINTIVIEEGVTGILDEAFADSHNLTHVLLPDSMSLVGPYVFSNCESLLCFSVNSSNPYFATDESGCLFNKDFTELVRYPSGSPAINYEIPNGVTSMKADAFNACKYLQHVTVPESITSLPAHVFSSSSELSIVELPDTLTDIHEFAFYNTAFYNNVNNWENGALYHGSYLIDVSEFVEGTFTIKDGTKLIAERACSKYNISNVVIPNSVAIICSAAFMGSQITSLDIPDGVTIIPDAMAACCRDLASVTIPDGVTEIGENAFTQCDSLKNIVIPNSVTLLDNGVFHHCKGLESITIGTGVERIETYAFYECNNLKDVYYLGSETQWNSIWDGNMNDSLFNADIHFLHEHINTYVDETPSTCTVKGVETVICLDCGAVLSSRVLPLADHEWDEGDTMEASTCTVPGTILYHCKNCTATKEEALPLAEHTWDAGIVKTVATYLAEGEMLYTCTLCPATKTEVIDKLVPDETKTNEENGISVSYQNDVLPTDLQVNVDQLFDGVSFKAINREIGNVKTALFNITLEANGEPVQPNGPVLVKLPIPAGYNKDKLSIYYISNDGTTHLIPSYVDGDYIYFETDHFSEYAIIDNSQEADPLLHDYNSTVTVEPGCESEGVETYTCSLCDDTYTETIPALGHTDDNNDGHCDRCGEQMTGGDHCKFCGKIHNGGFFDKLTGFFHKIFAIFKR